MILSVGCTQATPEFEVLDEDNIPRPTFDGEFSKVFPTDNGASTFAVSGECDRKIRALHGMPVGLTSTFEASMKSLVVSGVNLTCSSDGKFSFELKSLTDLGFTPVEGKVFEIQIRAETSAGFSKPSTIRIAYSKAAGTKHPTIVTAGSVLGGGDRFAQGTTYKAEIRVGNKILNSAPTSADDVMFKTGATYKARVGIRNSYSDD